jgi:dethiobiotin synthetase
MQPIFITGIGTGVGKTVASAIITEALQANYWKPIQAGIEDGTDANTVQQLISNSSTIIFDELYKFALPASPHIAAREENIQVEIQKIVDAYASLPSHKQLVIEGAGGIMVPINSNQFIVDIIKALQPKVILVSRNYLGSINHSLLTAQLCKQHEIPVVGWLFNDNYLQYEKEISNWTNIPIIGSIPFAKDLNKSFIESQANTIRQQLHLLLQNT